MVVAAGLTESVLVLASDDTVIGKDSVFKLVARSELELAFAALFASIFAFRLLFGVAVGLGVGVAVGDAADPAMISMTDATVTVFGGRHSVSLQT